MRIAALVHFYVPHRNAGSETMLHTLLSKLASEGHEVIAFTTDQSEAEPVSEVDGVGVVNTNLLLSQQNISKFDPHVIVTHHDNTPRAAQLAKRLGCPWVFLMHNEFSSTVNQLDLDPDLTVFNTRWIARKCRNRIPEGSSIVVHPPIWAENHQSPTGDSVTLVNLNEDKGSGLLYWLARNMPDVSFLGVEGGHGIQVINEDLPNVDIVRHTADMKADVWSRTRILIMPSRYESYGMAGIEALASGIPVIANPTPGLLESLSFAGTFVDRSDGQGWVNAIDSLLEGNTYYYAAAQALQRSAELNPTEELDEWAQRVEELAKWSISKALRGLR